MQRYVRLADRAFIEVSGPDRAEFLQGLITQDVTKLNASCPLLYGALLTPQGKFLFDFFLWHEADKIVIETDADRRDELLATLSKYKLRKNVTMTPSEGDVFQVLDGGFGIPDPRHSSLGARSLTQPNGVETSLDEWTALRLKHDVPIPAKDLRVGLSSPFEGNIDLLNGIAFDKGCYMGQELVSRIHHRGLVKKRFPNL